VRSADDALRQEFGVGLTDENVHILDPFTGTGTFMVRLLQNGLIAPQDLERKYQQELHANEIVLLAYYIAAINIEAAFHDLQKASYQPFNGIVLTDTFQMFESQGTLNEVMFPENNQRVVRQRNNDIRVIIGNPPYSAGQTSENDGNKNLKYPALDDKIRDTYARYSSATLKNSLYDSYIRAIRWASDRIKDRGIVCFVTNGSFIDSNAMDGLRKCLTDEFTSVYCFNLRGNARTSGEQRRMEKGNVFGEGTRTPVSITLLIKNPEKAGQHKLFYHDIGDYLSREEKLDKIKKLGSFISINWDSLLPNDSQDWINQRDPAFDTFISLGDKTDKTVKTIFNIYSSGIATSRDPWTYNFSKSNLIFNMVRMIDFYKSQVISYHKFYGDKPKNERPDIENFIDTNPTKISWTRALKNGLINQNLCDYSNESVCVGIYRPYCKQYVYFDRYYSDMVSQMPKIFPNREMENLVIAVTGIGASKDFSALIADSLINRHLQDTGQCFPLYTTPVKVSFSEIGTNKSGIRL